MTITLITGANKGIGYETARQLIELGHTVYVGARDRERGTAAASALGAEFVQLDVTDDSSVHTALAEIEQRENHLDVLINNAAILGGMGGIEEITGPDALAAFDTNTVGVIRVTQAALPLLRRSANPVVVNVSGALASFGVVTNPERYESQYPVVVYAATKAAVSMLTVQYAKAVPQVKFNAVEPGFTATDMTAGIEGGRAPKESVAVIVALATIGPDGPNAGFFENGGVLPW
jgi:NAD(P)-dependent dehydrogenase (short-subunit alcohol dehydrogenase family)